MKFRHTLSKHFVRLWALSWHTWNKTFYKSLVVSLKIQVMARRLYFSVPINVSIFGCNIDEFRNILVISDDYFSLSVGLSISTSHRMQTLRNRRQWWVSNKHISESNSRMNDMKHMTNNKNKTKNKKTK